MSAAWSRHVPLSAPGWALRPRVLVHVAMLLLVLAAADAVAMPWGIQEGPSYRTHVAGDGAIIEPTPDGVHPTLVNSLVAILDDRRSLVPATVGTPTTGRSVADGLAAVVTPAEIDDGTLVAAVGTLTANGDVVAVAAVAGQVRLATAAGATVVLVPADQVVPAREAAPADVLVLPVRTLTDALAQLAGVSARLHP